MPTTATVVRPPASERPSAQRSPACAPTRAALLKSCGAAALPLLLSACSWSWFGLNSHAVHGDTRTHAHASGALGVAPAHEFVYQPARSGRVSANRIENTAMTVIVLKSDIAQTVRDDVERSLHADGLRIDDDRRMLSARIESFHVDDQRSPASWTLKMHYVLTDTAARKVLFSATKTVTHKAPKFTSTTIAIDDTVRLSVDALLEDRGFVKALN